MFRPLHPSHPMTVIADRIRAAEYARLARTARAARRRPGAETSSCTASSSARA
jgi:hypothetical protein